MKLRTGTPPSGVIDEVLETDHVVNLSGVGIVDFPYIMKDQDDWIKYKGVKEVQAEGALWETNTCTNQALCEIFERFINYYYQNNLLSVETKKFLDDNGYMVDGVCNLSESYLAKTSKTDPQWGNSLTKNCVYSNRLGMVPESKWKDDYSSFNAYWRDLTNDITKLGEEFTKHFRNNYAWLYNGSTEYNAKQYDKFPTHLRQGLIYSAIPVCSPYNQSKVKYTGLKRSSHAIVVTGRKNGNTFISDSYFPMDKELTNDYLINAAMKVVVTLKKPMMIPTPTTPYVITSGKNTKYHRSMWIRDEKLYKEGIVDYISLSTGDVLKALPSLGEYAKAKPSSEIDIFPPNTGRTLFIGSWEQWNAMQKATNETPDWLDAIKKFIKSLT